MIDFSDFPDISAPFQKVFGPIQALWQMGTVRRRTRALEGQLVAATTPLELEICAIEAEKLADKHPY
jgi:hypothetical protein